MFLKKNILLASTGLILASSIAMADIKQRIGNLPDEGQIAINGKVESVESKKDFTLRDESGDTISVQTPSEITFNEGDNVEVHGHVGKDAMGEQKGITAFKVKINNNAQSEDATKVN
ncbi:MAG: hypothetical protein PQ612_08895 [Rickettsiales bacterium]|nr:hypothetical protein [Pseudomonadota bacterium]MDA0967304.1 hypothetical protein [Pseudomonadota bacterium]MDG4544035.1 hypothetical protein [Rickettsiales bacterium]MDG4546271.1 hypothetical protein [Rickettsiales bacterium]MDG4548359.1 hypothetical protein [Rickettsiales bacterium]